MTQTTKVLFFIALSTLIGLLTSLFTTPVIAAIIGLITFIVLILRAIS